MTDERRRRPRARSSYIIALAIVLGFTLWACAPKFAGMIGRTGIKPRLADGTYYGTVVSYGQNKFLILVDVQGHGYVEFRINGSTADDIMETAQMGKPGMHVRIKVGDGGDLVEWLWVRDLPGVRASAKTGG